MNKSQIIAVIAAVIFISALIAVGMWQLNQNNERLRLLQERAAGVGWNRPQEQQTEPDPEPAARAPKTSDFAPVKPDEYLTRAMFTVMVAAFEGVESYVSRCTAPHFSDVAAGEWYFEAVDWAIHRGVVTGIGNNMFAPDAPISREQIAIMLCNYMKYKELLIIADEKPETADYPQISGWALESVNTARAVGIVPDRADNTFDPQGKVTNAEADDIFENLLSLLNKE